MFSHAADEFCENASDRPKINGRPIILLKKDDFWSSVVASHNMTSQFPLLQLPLLFSF
jgi:hypothetical protein